MEVSSGVVLKSFPCYYSQKSSISSLSHVRFRDRIRFQNYRELKSQEIANPRNRKIGYYGFENKEHLEYYMVTPVCREGKGNKGWNSVSTKKKMKLLKGLAKDLSTFSDLGFGLELDCVEGLVSEDKSKMISEAAEMLLAQLKLLRSEEDKLKKKQKEEKSKSKTQDCESSSSSSESSDSECDEVVDMKLFRDEATITKPMETKEIHMGNEDPSLTPKGSMKEQVSQNSEQLNSELNCSKMILETTLNKDLSSIDVLSISSSLTPKGSMYEQISPNSELNCCNMILETTLNKDSSIEMFITSNRSKMGSLGKSEEKRIEVCMGGKCKKSGSPALMEEFQRVVGEEGVVVGCKCMGKCKSGPNVRVMNDSVIGDDSMRTPSNPLCVGVGLEDVGLIVANYFGEDKKGMDLAVVGVL